MSSSGIVAGRCFVYSVVYYWQTKKIQKPQRKQRKQQFFSSVYSVAPLCPLWFISLVIKKQIQNPQS